MRIAQNYKQDSDGQWWYYSKGRRWSAEVRQCVCGEQFITRSSHKGKLGMYCSTSCASRYLGLAKSMYSPPGPSHHNWKGGRHTYTTHGRTYRMIYAPEHPNNNKGYIAEHRLVMEKQLGRYLQPWEQVHHKNGDTLDNRIENLELWGLWGAQKQPFGQRATDMKPHCPTCTCFKEVGYGASRSMETPI